MSEAALLPLFPLEVVLLPGLPLPLHIFEPRYRRMIREVMQRDGEFGVLLARDNKVEALGCSAHVERIAKKHPDGRFDIETVGVRRFRTLEVDESDEYLQGAVEYFDDLPAAAPASSQVEALEAAVREAATLVDADLEDADLGDEPSPSFAACGLLPLDVGVKQEMLASQSEAERVEKLREYLETWTAQRKEEDKLRAVISRNGHVRRPSQS